MGYVIPTVTFIIFAVGSIISLFLLYSSKKNISANMCKAFFLATLSLSVLTIALYNHIYLNTTSPNILYVLFLGIALAAFFIILVERKR